MSAQSQETGKTPLPDPQDVAKTYAEVAQRASRLITEHMQRQMKHGVSAQTDELGIAQAFMDMMSKLLANSYKLAQAQMNLVWDYFSLWQHSMMRFTGLDTQPVAVPKKGFEDYISEGSLAALDAVCRQTGEDEVNLIGYCLGGTLLGSTLGYNAVKKDKRIVSATFFVALLDFSIPGELGVFIDEQQVASLEKKMQERGYLEGSEMATTFNMLRSNDLIWSFVVNNYLMGKEPFPFDLLYWNSDSTRMPYRMHSFYLRNMYMKNLLKEPGGIEMLGVPIDISKVKIPAYFISTIEDHIAPWKSTYLGATRLGGPVRFVLGGSGHIAGIVNPPSANKYYFWSNDAKALPATPDAWFEGATQRPGSWWTDWQQWIGKLNGDDKVPARDPAKGKLKPIEDAPGSFVKFRLDLQKKN